MDEQKTPMSDEELRAENDYLKMKLMLENGALFGGNDPAQSLPPEIENEFLHNVIEFEMQAKNPAYVKVFDKIGQPDHFKPAMEIPNEAMEAAWDAMREYLNEHGIDVSACSPNVTSRELYRFCIEELFDKDVDDINIKGLIHHFLYDEFHPDHQFENTELALTECVGPILDSTPFNWDYGFVKTGIRLNEHTGLNYPDFKHYVDRFKKRYLELDVQFLEADRCTVSEWESVVEGRFSVLALSMSKGQILAGKWKVVFEREDPADFWYVREVELEGINF